MVVSKYVLFSPLLGEMVQIDYLEGNHQLDFIFVIQYKTVSEDTSDLLSAEASLQERQIGLESLVF